MLQVKVHWQDISHWGKQNQLKEFPRSERVKLRNALKRLRLPYREVVAFINPHHNGGRMQWLDFAVWIPERGRMGVILFEAKWGKNRTTSKKSKAAFDVKKRFLQEHDTPVLVLPRYYATDEYELLLRRWVKTMDGR